MKRDKVLVPLDGSALAEQALPLAIDLLADRPTATLQLVRAAEATTLPGIDPTDAQVRAVRDAEVYLDAVAARLSGLGVKDVKTSVWYGPPAPAIVEAAQIGKFDVIVMATHGRSGLGRLVLGSVAESVLRGTHIPILFVRDAAAPLETVGSAGGPATGQGGSRV
jgi:nucleotide-binding universal stress UspA family protein